LRCQQRGALARDPEILSPEFKKPDCETALFLLVLLLLIALVVIA
jgi:hypothetical protein